MIFNNKKTVLETISNHIKLLQSPPLGDRGKRLYVIKIGGNIIDDETALRNFLSDFSQLFGGHTNTPSGDGGKKAILVHGGGKLATRIAEAMGVQQQMIDGRRITDAETLKIVTMVYAGYINKNIVAQLQSLGCNAIGLSGADGNSIKAHKRSEGKASPSGGGLVGAVDYGFVGDIDEVNAELLHTILHMNDAVVLAPITHDGNGQLLNTNADTIAQETAKAMSKLYDVELIYSFEKAGVLLDVNDGASVVPLINPITYEQLKEQGKIFAGMLPKLDNAFAAVNSGVKKVIIGKAEELHDLINGTKGTTISNE
ncbi:MAG: acetylglutamate kinase [Chitinophagaceae bacterium]|nr:acetylglutamate kinase [Chitinophagaceae bacterium]